MKEKFLYDEPRTRLRVAYEKTIEIQKTLNPKLYQWNRSNSKYILWLEDKVDNPLPKEMWVFFYQDILNLAEPKTLSIHKTKGSAYRAMRRKLNSEYMKWYNNRITFGKNRYGFRPCFDKNWSITCEWIQWK